jgi:acetyl-CoA C-acetyltransferase
MVPLSARDRLDDADGIRFAAPAALDATGISADELDLVDLYSCYPAAVRAHAEAIGLRDGLPLTITGGMRFAGGPFNNYVLHATGQLALRLRAGAGRYGAVSSVSGMLTKHAIGLWGTDPNPDGYQVRDVTDRVARQATPRPVRPDLAGTTTVAGYTVLYDHNVPTAAIAVLEAEDGARVIARSVDPAMVADMSSLAEQRGRRVTVAGGSFAEVEGLTRVP